jgi:hypothetical protein
MTRERWPLLDVFAELLSQARPDKRIRGKKGLWTWSIDNNIQGDHFSAGVQVAAVNKVNPTVLVLDKKGF